MLSHPGDPVRACHDGAAGRTLIRDGVQLVVQSGSRRSDRRRITRAQRTPLHRYATSTGPVVATPDRRRRLEDPQAGQRRGRFRRRRSNRARASTGPAQRWSGSLGPCLDPPGSRPDDRDEAHSPESPGLEVSRISARRASCRIFGAEVVKVGSIPKHGGVQIVPPFYAYIYRCADGRHLSLATKTRNEWAARLGGADCCVARSTPSPRRSTILSTPPVIWWSRPNTRPRASFARRARSQHGQTLRTRHEPTTPTPPSRPQKPDEHRGHLEPIEIYPHPCHIGHLNLSLHTARLRRHRSPAAAPTGVGPVPDMSGVSLSGQP